MCGNVVVHRSVHLVWALAVLTQVVASPEGPPLPEPSSWQPQRDLPIGEYKVLCKESAAMLCQEPGTTLERQPCFAAQSRSAHEWFL